LEGRATRCTLLPVAEHPGVDSLALERASEQGAAEAIAQRTIARGDTECQTLAGAIDDLTRRGFTESLAVVGDRLRVVEARKTFRPEDVVIREHRRFEGASDPDDMAIVYAIEAEDGTRGTLVDGYGVYADPAVSAFLSKVPTRRSR
jgi:hypothetical protein